MTHPTLPLTAVALCALLAACGGADVPSEPVGGARVLALALPAPAAGDPVAPLPEIRGLRVASAAQAAMLAARGAGDVLTLTLDAEGRVVRAEGPAPAASTLVFVDGSDLRRAATVAREVAAQGAARVWLVAR